MQKNTYRKCYNNSKQHAAENANTNTTEKQHIENENIVTCKANKIHKQTKYTKDRTNKTTTKNTHFYINTYIYIYNKEQLLAIQHFNKKPQNKLLKTKTKQEQAHKNIHT
uniref:FlaA locus uncharacterized protein ylxG n=1 Tax=Zeugodacus cucurbitae TaxID=28588 RepID=A0A0A1XTK0_ZEUCU